MHGDYNILFGAQVIVEQAAAAGGCADDVKHALELFLDLFGIFVRLVVILLRSQQRRRAGGDSDEGDRGRGGRAATRRR